MKKFDVADGRETVPSNVQPLEPFTSTKDTQTHESVADDSADPSGEEIVAAFLQSDFFPRVERRWPECYSQRIPGAEEAQRMKRWRFKEALERYAFPKKRPCLSTSRSLGMKHPLNLVRFVLRVPDLVRRLRLLKLPQICWRMKAVNRFCTSGCLDS